MRLFCLFLLTFPLISLAESYVIVSWGYNGRHSDGRIEVVRPPQELFDRCQIQKTLSPQRFQKLTGLTKTQYLLAKNRYTNLSLMTLSQLQCSLEFDTSSQKGIRSTRLKMLELLKSVRQRTPVRKIFGRSLTSIETLSKRIKIDVFRWGLLLDRHAHRGTGVNLPGTQTIVLGNGFWRNLRSAEYGPTFLLHEVLGILKIDDHEYQTSSALWWMHRNPSRATSIYRNLKYAAHKLRPASSGTRLAGTGSIVGNGGDPSELFSKISLLLSIPNMLEAAGRPNANPMYKKVNWDKLEQVILSTKFRTTKNSFVGYIHQIQDPRVVGMFPQLKKGDFLAVIPFQYVHNYWNQAKKVEEVLSTLANEILAGIAFE